MTKKTRKNTPADQRVLDSYSSFTEGLGRYLGEGYEVILHDLSDLDHSVMSIANGFHSGRTKGSPITDLGLSLLSDLEKDPDLKYMEYFNKDPGGSPIKSCTIVIRGEHGDPIGFMCINCYLGTSLGTMLSSFIPREDTPDNSSVTESFAADPSSLIGSALAEISDRVYRDHSISSSNKNKEIISLLYERGIFRLKDAVIEVADLMHISKNTVYMHLRNLR